MINPQLARGDTPEAIELSYVRSLEALVELTAHLRSGGQPPPSFAALTASEAEDAIIELRKEITRQATLSLIAAFEAVIRIDCFQRIHQKVKSGIGPLIRDRGRKFAFDAGLEDILDLWKQVDVDAHKVGRFKQALKRRHWLAHGRYWSDRTIWDCDPAEVRFAADDLFASLVDFPVQ